MYKRFTPPQQQLVAKLLAFHLAGYVFLVERDVFDSKATIKAVVVTGISDKGIAQTEQEEVVERGGRLYHMLGKIKHILKSAPFTPHYHTYYYRSLDLDGILNTKGGEDIYREAVMWNLSLRKDYLEAENKLAAIHKAYKDNDLTRAEYIAKGVPVVNTYITTFNVSQAQHTGIKKMREERGAFAKLERELKGES